MGVMNMVLTDSTVDGQRVKAGEEHVSIIDTFDTNATLGNITLQVYSEAEITIEIHCTNIREVTSDKFKNHEDINLWAYAKTITVEPEIPLFTNLVLPLSKFIRFTFKNEGSEPVRFLAAAIFS